jgi:hypothetical protein
VLEGCVLFRSQRHRSIDCCHRQKDHVLYPPEDLYTKMREKMTKKDSKSPWDADGDYDCVVKIEAHDTEIEMMYVT